MEYNIGDIVRTKKVHPCGSKLWEITRVGVDFKLKCQGCRACGYFAKRKSKKSNYKNREKSGIIRFLSFLANYF
ncbi:MAG: DUF951 domain-containing protein [Clostridia bacterium]|nr:DUF951 domain-containing protein [Clostridia bacterium]